MKRHFLSAVLLVLLSGSVSADGLIFKSPREGDWVQFTISDRITESDGTEVGVSGTLKMTALGTVDVNGETCRWIELVVRAKQNDEGFSHVDKLLIPVRDLAAGKDPLQHLQKMWRQNPETTGEVRDFSDFSGPRARLLSSLRPLLHGRSKDAIQLESIPVDTPKGGMLNCDGITYASESDERGTSITSSYTVRWHDQVPFGVMSYSADRNISRDGKQPSVVKMRLMLAEYGSDGVTVLPNRE